MSMNIPIEINRWIRFSAPLEDPKVTAAEARKRLLSEEDFVFLKRFCYSIKAVQARYPDGCPDRIIAQALMMSEEEVRALYARAIVKLRNIMGVVE